MKQQHGAGLALLVVLSLAGALVLPADASATELYASNHSTTTVSPFAIGADGSLTPLACAGISCNPGAGPVGLAVSPNGRFLYTANYGSASVSAFSITAGGSLSPVACTECTTGYQPFGLAVSPNGQFLYTSNLIGTVSAFSITAGGSLTPIACPDCTAGVGPEGLAVSANGKFLYTANSGSNSVSAFSIAAGGSLTPIACAGCTTAPGPYGVAISPNGQFLYTIDRGSSSVSAFSIAAGGSLTAIACAGCTTGSDPEGVAVSPNGRFLYTVNYSGSVSVFSIAAAGSLTPIACASTNCSVGLGPDFQSVAITPDQAPAASFTAMRPPSGQRYRFNGSSSSASPGQSVARYDWNFGDGSAAANAGPSPTHTYAAPGVYTVSLTVTDDAGCSTQLTFTGQTVSCNGSPAALRSERITVAGPRPRTPVITRVRESAKIWREANSGKSGPPVGTELSFTLNEPATVSLSFKRHRTAVTLTVRSHQGVNRIRFTGRISRIKKLGPGRYTLVIRARNAAGKRSARRSLSFTIVR